MIGGYYWQKLKHCWYFLEYYQSQQIVHYVTINYLDTIMCLELHLFAKNAKLVHLTAILSGLIWI